MNPKLVAVLLILVLAPLSVISWLGLRTARDEQQLVRHRFASLLGDRLADVDLAVSRVVEAHKRHLSDIIDRVRLESSGLDVSQQAAPSRPEPSFDVAAIRTLVREERLVRQIFIRNARNELLHPPPNAPRNENEEAFLRRTESIWDRGESFFRPDDKQHTAGAAVGQTKDSAPEIGRDGQREGWYTFYHGEGVNFIFWRRIPQGHVIGIEVDRVALLADIVGELPATDPEESSLADGRIQLVNANGDPVYVWGGYEPTDRDHSIVSRELKPPLGAWRLHYFAAPRALSTGLGKSLLFGTLASLAALAAAMIGLAVYILRESGRETREAQRRVTFVNQVSHELKTPLTNIRMYAELLEDQIDEEEASARNYLNIIVSESQRLSRLIANVLSFARQQRRQLTVRPSVGKMDEVIAAVVDQFRPGFEAAGFVVELDLQPDAPCRFDADALGQILGNLLNNVEKYASTGKWVKIVSRRQGDSVSVTVADRGPGIPAGSRRKVFQPFFRLSHRITEGVAGAGIGLSIAQELAREHGGDVRLDSSDGGAVFTVTLNAPCQTGDTAHEGAAGQRRHTDEEMQP